MVTLCFKCKKADGSLVNRDGSPDKLYCANCFTEFLTRNVRDQLFSHCLFPCDLPVAVGVSGGPNSMMMLHQLGLLRAQNAMRQGAGHVRFVLLPFHLCEEALVSPPSQSPEAVPAGGSTSPSRDGDKTTGSAPPPMTSAEGLRETFREQFSILRSLFTQQPLTWSWADGPLFEPSELRVFDYTDILDTNALHLVRACLHHPKRSLSEREDLYAAVKRAVLSNITHQLCAAWYAAATPVVPTRWAHLVTAENTVRSAVAALESIVRGEPSDGVVHKAGYRAVGSRGVVQMRPLRHVLARESVLYCRLHGIANSYTPSLSTGTSLRSMYRTLESFVLQLHVHYRTALFNVLTMTNKLACADPIAEAIVSGELDAIAAHATLHTPVEVDPPVKKSRTDRSALPPADVEPATGKARKSKSMNGRSAQHYRDACLRVSPPTTVQARVDAGKDAGGDTAAPISRHLCFLCGAPRAPIDPPHPLSSSAVTATTTAVALPAALCRRCTTTLCLLVESDAPSAATTTSRESALMLEQLLHVLGDMNDGAAMEAAPSQQVRGTLSAADSAAFLLSEDDD